MSFLQTFDSEWGPRLGLRRPTLRSAFEYLLKRRPEGHLIIETGCARAPGNWEGDGQSTYLFDQFAERCNGQVFSVDISPEACAVARSLVGDRTKVHAEDSVGFLKRIGTQLLQSRKQIDLLYLDSFDLRDINADGFLNKVCADD